MGPPSWCKLRLGDALSTDTGCLHRSCQAPCEGHYDEAMATRTSSTTAREWSPECVDGMANQSAADSRTAADVSPRASGRISQEGCLAEHLATSSALVETPRTRYAKSGEVHVAYQVLGEGHPVDIVHVQGAFTHLGVMWELPAFQRFCWQLGSFARLIWFDKRGMGQSDRVQVGTLEERMDDVRAVMDAVDSPWGAARSVRGRPAVAAVRGGTPGTD